MADYTPRVGDPVRLTVTLDGTVKAYDTASAKVTIVSASGNEWTHPLGYADSNASLASIELRVRPVPAWTAGDVIADTRVTGRVGLRQDDGSWVWTDSTTSTDADVASLWSSADVRAVNVKALA